MPQLPVGASEIQFHGQGVLDERESEEIKQECCRSEILNDRSTAARWYAPLWPVERRPGLM